MPTSIDALVRRAISPTSVHSAGYLTSPRSYGVYRLPANAGATKRFRFGNYPVRMRELEREFGHCTLEYLFLSRTDAHAVAGLLNGTLA